MARTTEGSPTNSSHTKLGGKTGKAMTPSTHGFQKHGVHKNQPHKPTSRTGH